MKTFTKTGSTCRRHDAGQPRTVSTEENVDLIEELVCLQKKRLHTHLALRKITEQTRISRTSIRRMVKKKRKLKQFSHLKTPQLSEGTRNRRKTSSDLLEKDLKVIFK